MITRERERERDEFKDKLIQAQADVKNYKEKLENIKIERDQLKS
ncbi:MAG: hypothetical protein NY202_01075 [Mollicutes bacterium UO1]